MCKNVCVCVCVFPLGTRRGAVNVCVLIYNEAELPSLNARPLLTTLIADRAPL